MLRSRNHRFQYLKQNTLSVLFSMVPPQNALKEGYDINLKMKITECHGQLEEADGLKTCECAVGLTVTGGNDGVRLIQNSWGLQTQFNTIATKGSGTLRNTTIFRFYFRPIGLHCLHDEVV
jgi:hypothetical protein